MTKGLTWILLTVAAWVIVYYFAIVLSLAAAHLLTFL